MVLTARKLNSLVSVQPPFHAMLSSAIDGAALRVGGDERVVARLLDVTRDFVVGLVPGDVFPMIGTRPAHLRFQHAPVVQDVLHQRGAFGTQRAAVDGMIGIAFHVHHLRR